MRTALQVAQAMPLPAYARAALDYERHPQQRTLAFHEFYNAPIRTNSEPLDRQFSHMDNARVAFRASFILSEVAEMFKKGLGIELRVSLAAGDNAGQEFSSDEYVGDDDALCREIKEMLDFSVPARDLVEVVDALGDLNVVVNGFAIELGVDMFSVDREVCASNFTKADPNGNPIVGDGITAPLGKVLKGPCFVEPQLAITLGLED